MKFCPTCKETYSDDNLNYCLNDGSALELSANDRGPETLAFGAAVPTDQPRQFAPSPPVQFASSIQPKKSSKSIIGWVVGIIIGVFLLCGGGAGGILLLLNNASNDRPSPGKVKPNEPSKPDERPTPRSTEPKNSSSISMEKYERIKIGMPRSEVEAILGGKGTEISSSTGGKMTFSVNKWEGEKYTSIILSFRDEKVMSKNQVGLK